jgi:hypothetical protein
MKRHVLNVSDVDSNANDMAAQLSWEHQDNEVLAGRIVHNHCPPSRQFAAPPWSSSPVHRVPRLRLELRPFMLELRLFMHIPALEPRVANAQIPADLQLRSAATKPAAIVKPVINLSALRLDRDR